MSRRALRTDPPGLLRSGADRNSAPVPDRSQRSPLAPAATLAVAAAATCGAPASADVLVSNIDRASAFVTMRLNVGRQQTHALTTGSHTTGYTLASVELKFSRAPSSDVRVRILDGTYGQALPGTTTIATLTNPSSLTAGKLTFTAPAGTTLAAGTTYVINVDAATSGNLNVTAAVREDPGGEPDWSIADFTSTSQIVGVWGTIYSSLQIRVNGTVAASDSTLPRSMTIARGSLSGAPLTAQHAGSVRMEIAPPPVPVDDDCGDVVPVPCYRGLTTSAGPPLVLFREPPEVTGTPPAPEIVTNDETRIDLSTLAAASDGGPLTFAAYSSDTSLLAVHVEGGILTVTSGDKEGSATVTVIATDAEGLTVAIEFQVRVEFASRGLLRGARGVLLTETAGSANE